MDPCYDRDCHLKCCRLRRLGGYAAVVVCAGRLRQGRARHPATGRAVPRPLRRGHPQEPLSDDGPVRRRALPAPRPDHPRGARLSRVRPRRPAGRVQLSGPRVPLPQRTGQRIPPGRDRSFGRQDRAAADAETLALALEATAAFGVRDVEIRTGDVALFNALLDALDLYPVWRRRLVKDFHRKISLEQDLEGLRPTTATDRSEYEGVLAALAGSDRKAALAFVTDLMSIAGTTNVGGRTTAEIADRFLEQSTLKGGALPREAITVLKRFLSISGNPDDAVAAAARADRRRKARP